MIIISFSAASNSRVGGALLRVYSEALRLNTSVDRLGKLEEEHGMTVTAPHCAQLVTMFVRAKRLDDAMEAKVILFSRSII